MTRPDKLAATAAAALALRDLLKFHEHEAAVRVVDEDGLLAGTADVPAPAEIEQSLAMLLGTLAAAEIGTDAGAGAVLRLVEHIVSDAALGREPAARAELLAAVHMLQGLRARTDVALAAALPPVAPAPSPANGRTIVALVERWRTVDTRLADHGGDIETIKALLAEADSLAALVAAGRSRGDADLLAKAGLVRQMVEDELSEETTGLIARLALSLAADVGRLIGAPPAAP